MPNEPQIQNKESNHKSPTHKWLCVRLAPVWGISATEGGRGRTFWTGITKKTAPATVWEPIVIEDYGPGDPGMSYTGGGKPKVSTVSGVKGVALNEVEVLSKSGGVLSNWWNNHWTAKIIPDVVYINVGLKIATPFGYGYNQGYALQVRGQEGFGLRAFETGSGANGVHGSVGINGGYASYSGDSRNFSFSNSFFGKGTTGFELDYGIGLGIFRSPTDEMGGVLRLYDIGAGPGYGASYTYFSFTSPL